MRSLDESITATQRSSDEASRSTRQGRERLNSAGRAKSATKALNSLRHEEPLSKQTRTALVTAGWTRHARTGTGGGEAATGDQKGMLLFPWATVQCSLLDKIWTWWRGAGLNTMCLSASRVSVIFQLHARHCPLPLLPPAQHRSPPAWAVSLAASGNPAPVDRCPGTSQTAHVPCKPLYSTWVSAGYQAGYSFRHSSPSADPCHHMPRCTSTYIHPVSKTHAGQQPYIRTNWCQWLQ